MTNQHFWYTIDYYSSMDKDMGMAKDTKKGQSRKTKSKKMSKSDADARAYRFFNVAKFKDTDADTFISSLYTNAADILKEHNLEVKVWYTFAAKEEQVKKMWDKKECFIRFWLDQAINEFGYMIWNLLFDKYFKEDWYIHGILHDVPELPKKLKSNPEAVAGHFADAAVTKFGEYYS